MFDVNPDCPIQIECRSEEGAVVLGIVQYLRAKKSATVKIWAEECFGRSITIYPAADEDESITLHVYMLGDKPVNAGQLVTVHYRAVEYESGPQVADSIPPDDYVDIFADYYAQVVEKVKNARVFRGDDEKQQLLNIETAEYTLFGEGGPTYWSDWNSASLICEETTYSIRSGSKSKSRLLARIKFPITWEPFLRQFEDRQFEKTTVIHPVAAPVPLKARVAKLTDGTDELYVRATKKLPVTADCKLTN